MIRVLSVFVLVVCCSTSFSQTGVLDQTFGVGGKVISAVPYSTQGDKIKIGSQANGKIIVMGSLNSTLNGGIYVTRHNIDGSLDSSFGINGKVIKILNGTDDQATALVVQQDDKIIVGGNTYNSSQNGKDVFLIRFQSNGHLDSTFGNSGVLNISLMSQTGSEDFIKNLFIVNGKILVCGGSTPVGSSDSLTFLQLNYNGTLDSSFGYFGIIKKIIKSQLLSSSVPTKNQKLIVGGWINQNQTFSFNIQRYTKEGIIDTTFGTDGNGNSDTIIGFTPNQIIIDSDEKIVCLGKAPTSGLNASIQLCRFDSLGRRDTSFGKNGIVNTIEISNDAYEPAIQQQPNRKYVLSSSNNNVFFVGHFNNDGNVDTSFGKKGYVKTSIQNNGVYHYSSILQDNGSLILAGTTKYTSNVYYVMAKYLENGRYYYNTINGSAFRDGNSNGIRDSSESFLKDANFIIVKNGFDTIIASTFNTSFSIDVDTGLYQCLVKPYHPYYNIIPAIHNTTFSTYFSTDSVSFALQPIFGKKDLAIDILSLGGARPSFPVQYKIVCRNQGTDTISNGTIELVKDSKLVFNYALPPIASINGDTLKWNYSNLKPLDTVNIILYCSVQPPPSVNIGDTLHLQSTIYPLASDQTIKDNFSVLNQIVRNSFDPNDKTENHGGKITNTQVANGEYMQYTIRFQNTGNDTAFNVYIHDTLDSKLNWNTLQIITASHNYQMNLSDGKCLFKFPGINLVDSIHNEPGSHGYIVYRIKPLPTVQIGDVIKNTAAIYFDYNLPIYTNTEMTTVVAETLPLKLLTFTARRSSSSLSLGEGRGEVLLNWTTANETNVDHFIVERSANGSPDSHREFNDIGKIKAGGNNYTYTDNNPTTQQTTPNSKPQTIYYRLKMLDKDGQFTYSPIRMINNSGTFSINIYPNPAKDNLQIQIESDRNTALQLQVLSMDGKIILSNSVSVKEGSILRSINIGTLAKGSYFLKVVSLLNNPIAEMKAEQVIKFEKL